MDHVNDDLICTHQFPEMIWHWIVTEVILICKGIQIDIESHFEILLCFFVAKISINLFQSNRTLEGNRN